MKHLNETFVDFADAISAGMGTPLNIFLWLVAVIAWFILFATHPQLQNTSFLPSWFTSNSFNFPLNSITTLAELYIGFLVAAAANRVEKRNKEQVDRLEAIEEHIGTLVEGMSTLLEVDHKEHGELLRNLYGLNEEQLKILHEDAEILRMLKGKVK